jgi:hypothetical protein
MPHTPLIPQIFTPQDQAGVQQFDCGNEPWAAPLAEWIKGEGVLDSIQKHKNRVWLYRTANSDLVGFGSIGIARWRWPPPNGPWTNLSLIPALAIQSRFHRQPDDVDKSQRFSSQVMDHLLGEAAGHDTDFVVLEVHRQNVKAIRFYDSYGFEKFSEFDKQFGNETHPYQRMGLRKRASSVPNPKNPSGMTDSN